MAYYSKMLFENSNVHTIVKSYIPHVPILPLVPECNCNGHASRCHFDAAVWERSGRVSGGVCDDCRDNTMGLNCEQCVPFYYKDPQRDSSDPYACQRECLCCAEWGKTPSLSCAIFFS